MAGMSISTRSRLRAMALDVLIVYTLDLNEVEAATFESAPLSNREGQVLFALRQQPGMTPTELAELLGLSRSAIARLLGRLDQEGYLSRSTDPSDRRSVRLALGDAGARRVRSFLDELERFFISRAPMTRYLLETSGHAAMVDRAPSVSALAAMESLVAWGARYIDDLVDSLEAYRFQTASDRYTVSLLHIRGPQRPTDLALALRLTSGGVSQLLDRLEDRLLVQRMPPLSGDLRAVLVELTPRGMEVAERLLDVFDAHFDDICAALATTLHVGRR